MTKIVQILAPTQSIGYHLVALDSEGQLLVGTVTSEKSGPAITWQTVLMRHK